jgi:hypothetical protein
MAVSSKVVRVIVAIIIIVVLVLAVRFIFGGPEDDWICQDGAWVKHGNPSAPMPTVPCRSQDETKPYLYKDLIRIDSPLQNQKISSPITVKGEARGNWYFEASFPIQVLDENGEVLGVSPVQAQGEWMTENFVPFSGEIIFSKPKGKSGSIIFKKDNPSGLSEFDDFVSIPINFE